MNCVACQHDEDCHSKLSRPPCYDYPNNVKCSCKGFVEPTCATCGHGARRHSYGKYEGGSCNERGCGCPLWDEPQRDRFLILEANKGVEISFESNVTAKEMASLVADAIGGAAEGTSVIIGQKTTGVDLPPPPPQSSVLDFEE